MLELKAASMLVRGAAMQVGRGVSLSVVLGDKGVTTDKPFVLGACVRDKATVLMY